MTRRPTIIDVAKLAGVSKATVGRVVNGQNNIVSEDTLQRVLTAIHQLGYERNAVAGSLRTDQTNMIALSIPDITTPFWPAVARGVQDTLEADDYTVVTVNSDWDTQREAKYLKMVRRNRFDGLIINPTDPKNTEFNDLNIPVVILGSANDYPDYDTVGSDTEAAVQDALEYLFTLGHRRIGLIAGFSARRSMTTTRYHSYLTFLARNHLKLDPALVIYCEFSMQAGAESMRQLLSLPDPPTAVFAANDILAIGAMQCAQAMNWQIPEDISIFGMDDIYAASMTSPPLSTITKPKYAIGVQAAQILLARLRAESLEPCQTIRLHCDLNIRGTTGPSPAR